MAALSSAISFARTQTQTDSNGLTDANAIIFANEAKLDIHRKMIARGVDASQLQESYRDGTVDQGTYLYPTDMWWLKNIEVNYGSTTAADYKRADQVDVANLPNGVSMGWLRKNASTNEPKFDDRGDYFEIFPTPISGNNVSQMMRITYYLEPSEFSSTSDTIDYPISLDYRMLGWRLAANYLYSLGKVEEGDAFFAKYEEKIDDIVKTLSRGSQQPIQATPLQITGWEF